MSTRYSEGIDAHLLREQEEFASAEWEEERKDVTVSKAPPKVEGTLWLARIQHGGETVLCQDPNDTEYSVRECVVVPTRYGNDLADILGKISVQNAVHWEEVLAIVRRANEQDFDVAHSNSQRAKEAYDLCRKKIDQHKLDMKLISVHFMLEEPKILFFFTSENRVDFRDLVKDLVAVFHQRIELRQIGVRDEARIVGGKGVCGRALCCNCLSDRLQPVSIKMAKVQNLSLNSMKISGPCGRLLCCLSYEYDAYKQDRKDFPQDGHTIRHEGLSWSVIDVNVIGRTVLLRCEDGRQVSFPRSSFSHGDGGWTLVPKVVEAKI